MAFHPRIHPVNYSLLRELPADHPAVRALQVHAEACDMCVGKEIDWPHLQNVAIDQVWFSDHELRECRFSAFAYQYISYDLLLDGWVESAPEATKVELGFLGNVAKTRTLLDECEQAAREEQNRDIAPLIAKAREFIDSLERAILFRFEQHGIEVDLGGSKEIGQDPTT